MSGYYNYPQRVSTNLTMNALVQRRAVMTGTMMAIHIAPQTITP
jgi:hypothetical protein